MVSRSLSFSGTTIPMGIRTLVLLRCFWPGLHPCLRSPAELTQRSRVRLALTPPMGWNSWNKFACNVSEDMIKSMADAMVKSGMKDAGYQYVNIDDCWQVSRDANGNIVADPQRFPHGMKAVGDYIHSLGLKFGVYSDAGSKTCAGRPGGLGHEYQDAIAIRGMGRRLSEIRLVQHHHAGCESVLCEHPRRARRFGPRHRAEHLRVGHGQALAVGKRSRRQLVADHRRHPGSGGQARRNGQTGAAVRTACWPSSISKSACSPTPGPDIGTILTCWKWATAA